MSIFRRDNDAAPPESPATSPRPAPRPATAEPRPRESTHIAAGSKVVGEISGSAELVIDGQVEGQIALESRVVVGSKGQVEGEIQARSVQVGGTVVGNVRGLERVEVLASGRLEGDVISPRVVISEGAFFKGKVEMTDKAAVGPVSESKPKPKPMTKEPPSAEKAEKAPDRDGADRRGTDGDSAGNSHSKQGGRIVK
ncbi:MAG: polymer-forming cytoskeletal protein [bacterium]|nr:polymer-forming cytoskeletal protein [bacterium]